MGNKPIKKFSAAGISLAVFEKEMEKDGNKFKVQSMNLQRSYKDGDEWKNTNSLRKQDLPIAIMLLVKAQEHLANIKEE